MNITIDETILIVKFWFAEYVHRETFCEIKIDPNTSIGFGRAMCHDRDQFRKTTGRKIAFARALENAHFIKDQRRQAWEQYWKAMPRR